MMYICGAYFRGAFVQVFCRIGCYKISLHYCIVMIELCYEISQSTAKEYWCETRRHML